MERREQTELEKMLSDVSHRLFYLQYRKHYKKRSSSETINTVLYHFKYTPDCVFDYKTHPGQCTCLVKLLNVEIGSGTANNKKEAKNIAFQNGCSNLTKPYCRVVLSEKDSRSLILETADSPFPEILNPINAMEEFLSDSDNHLDNRIQIGMEPENLRDLSKFVIYRITDGNHSELTSNGTLWRSANFNKSLLEMDFRVQNGEFECMISIGGQPIVEGTAANKVLVKELVSEKALEYLSSICWTLYKRKKNNTTKMELESALMEIEKLKNTGLSDVYKKLGDIYNELAVQHEPEGPTFVTREGFTQRNNHSRRQRKFTGVVKAAIQEHISFSRCADLAFDSTFSANERKKILRCAQKFDVVVSEKFMNHQIYTVISKKEIQVENNMINIGNSGYFLTPPKPGKCTITPLNVQLQDNKPEISHDCLQQMAQDDQGMSPDSGLHQGCGPKVAQSDQGRSPDTGLHHGYGPEVAQNDQGFSGVCKKLGDIYNELPVQHEAEGTKFVTREGFVKRKNGYTMTFTAAVKAAIQEHVSFSTCTDLAFDSTFTFNEREKILKCAKKFNVVVSKKLMNHQIYTVISKKEKQVKHNIKPETSHDYPQQMAQDDQGISPNTGIHRGCGPKVAQDNQGRSQTGLHQSCGSEIAQDNPRWHPDTGFHQDYGREIAQNAQDHNTAQSDMKLTKIDDQSLFYGNIKQERDEAEFQNKSRCIHHEKTIKLEQMSDCNQLQSDQNVSFSKRQATSQEVVDTKQYSKKTRPNYHPNMQHYKPRSYSFGAPNQRPPRWALQPHTYRPANQGPPPYGFPPANRSPYNRPPYSFTPHDNRPQCLEYNDKRQWYTDDCEDSYSHGPVW